MYTRSGLLTATSAVRPLLTGRLLRVLLMVLLVGAAVWGVPALVHAADPNGSATLEADPSAAINMSWT